MNMAGEDSSPQDQNNDVPWPDLYELLGVAPDVSATVLRTRIREAFMEATRNAEHRNIELRQHYQKMGQRIVPQARRILMEERTRRAYDEQLALHKSGDAAALSYPQFIANLAALEAGEKAAPYKITTDAAQNGTEKTAKLFDAQAERLARNQRAAQLAENSPETPNSSGETAPISSTRTTARTSGRAHNSPIIPAPQDEEELEKNALGSAENVTPESVKLPYTKADDAIRNRDFVQNNESATSARKSDTLWDKVPRNASAAPAESNDANAENLPENSAISGAANSENPSDAPFADANLSNDAPKTDAEEIDEIPILQRAPTPAEIAARDEKKRMNDQKTDVSSTRNSETLSEISVVSNANLRNSTAENASANAENIVDEDGELGDENFADADLSGEHKAEIAPKAFYNDDEIVFPPNLTATRDEPLPIETNQIENEARRARVLRVERGARPLTSEQVRSTSGQDLGHGVRGIVSSGRAKTDENFKSRVSLDEKTPESAPRNQNESLAKTRDLRTKNSQKRVLKQPVLLGLTALISAALVVLITQLRGAPDNTIVEASTLRLVYSSDLQSFMEQAQRKFHVSPQGQNVNLDLRPVDSRDGMHLVLGVSDGAPSANSNEKSSTQSSIPDVWIPGETLWSNRYNQVATKFRQRPISVARSLAVSPLVLITRTERAGALRRRFPNRMIPSWDALQRAIQSDAAGHFGLADPQKTGSGALARMFMAREWCEKRKIPWNKKSASDPRLWRWLSVFEDNVPEYASLTGDMVKELAVGNADRYWWAIGYESDAIAWMRRGQKLQIFYLPRTALAEHPFCYIERSGMTASQSRARSDFERFLRSRAMQTQLLQNGFRPTEIALNSVVGNPFARADFRALGLRASGFRIDGRINYDTLNALNVQWKNRYSG